MAGDPAGGPAAQAERRRLIPPSDPRSGWALPAPGRMATVTRLSELATRVVAPNTSHMTLDGTNTYVLAAPGSGSAIVVDPGPPDPAHKARVDEVLAADDLGCALVLVTHHHHDHTEAARSWAGSYGCPVMAPSSRNIDDRIQLVSDGDQITIGGLKVGAVGTPGHCSDHTAYRLEDGTLLSGDHILGRGTAVVAFPDGDLPVYLESLRKVLKLGPDRLYPGHGPDLADDPSAVVTYYLDHRAFREAQIVAALADGMETPNEMVRRIYADVPEILWPAAECSTRAALAKLSAERRVSETDDRFRLLD